MRDCLSNSDIYYCGLFSYRYTPTHSQNSASLSPAIFEKRKNLAETVHYHERHFKQEVATG